MFGRKNEALAAVPGPAGQLWRMITASKAVFTLSVAAGLIAGVSNAVLMSFINRALAGGSSDASALAPAFFGLCLVVLFSGAVSVILLQRMAQNNLYKLRLDLARRILAAPLRGLQACGPHRLMAALTEDINKIIGAQVVLPILFVEASTAAAVLIYLALLSPTLFLVVFAFLVFGVLSFRVPQGLALSHFEAARKAYNTLSGHYRALAEGHKELKMDARRRRAFLDEEMDAAASLFRERQNSAWLMFVLGDRWGQSLYFILIGTILFLAPLVTDIPRETLLGYILVILFLGGPISMVLNAAPAIGLGVVALKNIESLNLRAAGEPEFDPGRDPPAQAAPPAALPAEIELAGVIYEYQGDHGETGYRLGPIDLRIRPGELLFMTGGNGSGKTTLALVILGLYPPDSGEIRFRGQIVTAENRDAYRQNFAAVFADSYLFESLLGYSTTAQHPRAEELLALLQLDGKLSIENGRFSTIDLSRGQRKRLALLTAYLADRPVYLFDEWAAEQDPVFRDLFYREMLPELKARGKTVIVITHDDRYFQIADRRLHLNSGRIESVIAGAAEPGHRSRETVVHA
jgi:putative pyoverdin transport system ATP-binding/permease protein